jgi:hypothetical protein
MNPEANKCPRCNAAMGDLDPTHYKIIDNLCEDCARSEKTNEVARLTCSLCEKQHDYSYEECLIKESGRSIVGEFKELNNEVARLRELLNRAIEIADHAYEFCGLINPELDELKAEARLAPAPYTTNY